MSDIQTFLAHVVPWPTAATPGWINVHWKMVVKDKTDPVFPGRAFQQHQTACSFTTGMMRGNHDLFICTSLQSRTQAPKVGRGGKTRYPAVRANENSLLLQAFWFDVDLKGGGYRDTEHALYEFVVWLQKTGMPMPTFIVLSGSGGFHAWWVLDEPVTLQQWEPVAYALNEAARVEGFKPDFQVTIKPAGLMRIPGTFNHKHTPPVLARITHPKDGTVVKYQLAALDAVLSKYRAAYAPGVKSGPQQALTLSPGSKPSSAFQNVPLPGRLDAGVDTTGWQPTIEQVADECPFIRNVKDTEGDGRSEKEWWESIKIAYYCKDGLAVAHELSWGDDRYTEAQTDDYYWNHVDAYHSGGRLGPPTCAHINGHAPECKTCPHWPPSNNKQSPVNLVKLVAPAQPAPTSASPTSPVTIPTVTPTKFQLPPNYVMGKDGLIYKIEEDDKRPLIMPYRLLNIWVQRPGEDDDGEWALNMEVETTKTSKPIVTAQFTYEELYDQRKLGSALGKQGIGLYRHELKLTADFMVSFVQQLQQSTVNRIEESVATGWQVQNGKRCAFVYGGVYNANGTTRNVVPRDRYLHELYSPHGTLDAWKAACKLLTDQKRPDMNAGLAASFGAPLVGLAGFTGLTMVLRGDSGIGKSHSLRCGLSAWAHPTLTMGRWDDTANSVDTKLGNNPNAPCVFDELKDEVKARKLTDQIMMLGQGKTKGRNNRASKAMHVMAWATMMLMGTNTSVADLMEEHVNMTVAGLNRVFEIASQLPRTHMGLIERTRADIIIRDLDANYGHAGAIYSAFLGKDPDFVADYVARLVEAVDKAVQGTKDDRFHIPTVAVTVAGAQFANHIGLTDIDDNQLMGFLIEQLQEQRNRRRSSRADLSNESNVLRFIEDYLSQRRDFTLVTDRMWRSNNRPTQGWSAGTPGRQDLRGVMVHASRQDNIARFSLSDFRAYLKRLDVNSAAIVSHILQLPSATKTKAYLGLGTMYRDPNRQDIIELDLSKATGVFSFD